MLLCACLLISCQSEIIERGTGSGYLALSVGTDTSEDIVVKAGTEDHVFAVGVYNASGKLVKSADDHRTVTEENPFTLNVGNYVVKASEGMDLNAAFNNPVYKGESAAKINPDKTETVNISCSLANTVFSVSFPEDFASKFQVYEVSVTNGVGDVLVLSNSPEAGNKLEAGFDSKAYFAVTGLLQWELYLKSKDNGGEYREKIQISDVKAKQHYNLSFSIVEDEQGGGAFAIKVRLDSSLNETAHDLELNFDNRDLPSITLNEEFSAVSGEPISVPFENTGSKVLTFNTPAGLRSLKVLHCNDNLASSGLPYALEIVGLTMTDAYELDEAGITISSTDSKTIIDITTFVSRLKLGNYKIQFTVVDDRGHFETFNLDIDIISDVDAEAVSASAGWAAFVKLDGRFFTSQVPDGMTFQYRKTADTQWITVPESDIQVNASTMKFSTVLNGLEPSTQYTFRAISNEDVETKEITFTTAAAPVIHNLNFDSWSNGDSYYPNASGFKIWDSANSSGAATTTLATSDAVSGKAAQLKTVTVFGVLAAGNIFTGRFVGLQGFSGAELDWGVPFSGRPLALKLYFKYFPKEINKTKDPHKDKAGQTDQCQILMSLTDWNGPSRIDTSAKTFVDFDKDPGIIAYGIYNTSETVSEYKELVIPLVYNSNTRIPKYLVIAGAASRYGDYFTGGEGSELFIDEMEFIYDPADLTQEQYDAVFSKVNPF